jgi:hypothetical protein
MNYKYTNQLRLKVQMINCQSAALETNLQPNYVLVIQRDSLRLPQIVQWFPWDPP